jgi:putative transposase
VHQQISKRRADFLHQLTSRLVQAYDGFCLEDLSTRGLARTKLAKSVLDAAWGEFGRQLQYKAEWAGKPVVKVDRWFPSSKTYSGCGWLLAELPLSVRAWTCPGCGVVHDRDRNARTEHSSRRAQIVGRGARGQANARGAAVRSATGRHAA